MLKDNNWLQLRGAKDEDISLLSAALLIAKDEYPGLTPADYETQFEEYSRRLRNVLDPTETPAAQLRCLNRFLFEDLGFSGDEQD